jgi:hypothetical protein
MKRYYVIIWVLAISAIVLTGIGGMINMIQKLELTSQHLWNDGLFLMLLAILIAIMYQ